MVSGIIMKLYLIILIDIDLALALVRSGMSASYEAGSMRCR